MNPFFPMNQNNNDEERHSTAFEIDEETNVYFLEQAYAYHEQFQQEENPPRLTRNPIHRDRERAEERLMGDYFDDHSKQVLLKKRQESAQKDVKHAFCCSRARTLGKIPLPPGTSYHVNNNIDHVFFAS
ncbi:hypothetical protein Tco_1392841 [Tanacetum coccineum]